MDAKELYESIKENRRKLDACKGHRFNEADVAEAIKLGFGLIRKDLTCSACGGVMRLSDVDFYTRGYEAAGGNPNDVMPGFRTAEEVIARKIALSSTYGKFGATEEDDAEALDRLGDGFI